jgi:hypothetical protein
MTCLGAGGSLEMRFGDTAPKLPTKRSIAALSGLCGLRAFQSYFVSMIQADLEVRKVSPDNFSMKTTGVVRGRSASQFDRTGYSGFLEPSMAIP